MGPFGPFRWTWEERTVEHMYESGGEPASRPATTGSAVRQAMRARLSALGDDELTDESVRLAAAVSAAQAELAMVLGEVERRRLHSQWDCPSIERFAGWKCQLASSRAAALGSLGRAMETLPTLGDAVLTGELAVDKAVAIARVASPVTEVALVELARHATVEQTRRFCAKWRRVGGEAVDESANGPDEVTARHADEAALGRVIVIHDEDGVELRARFDHVHGALVLGALDAVTAAVRAERRDAVPADPAIARRRRADVRSTPASVDEVPREGLDRGQWRAQGLLRLCELAAATTPTTIHRSGFTAEVVVHVPVSTLLDAGDVAEIESNTIASNTIGSTPTLEPRGIGLTRELARSLVCDAGLHNVLEDETGDPLHVGRRRSSISAVQRRAVHARHPHCTWPGCTAITVQLHHRHHRVAGGHDDVENLVPLCTWHHGVVHRRSIVVGRRPDGTLEFIRGDGSQVGNEHSSEPTVTPPGTGSAGERLRERQRRHGIDVDSPLRASQWLNDPFHLSDVIAAVADRRDAALRRTVPT